MQNFFCCSDDITKDGIEFTDPAKTHHIKDVLRLRKGDEVLISDDKGDQYYAIVDLITDEAVKFKIKGKKRETLKKLSLTVACAIPKKAGFDDIIDKLTQLGVDKIVPLMTERVIVKLDQQKLGQRLIRWRKIALSASQQSQRNVIPVIEKVTDIKDFLLNCGMFDLKLIPTLSGERKFLRDVLSGSNPKNIVVLIGPEGDFSPQEVVSAVKTKAFSLFP